MGWSTPATFSTGQLIGATDLNTYVRDNTNYLLARPKNAIKRDNNANYTSTSTSFVDIDGTNLAIVLSISGTTVLLNFQAVYTYNGGTYVTAAFDFTVDGSRYAAGGVDGLMLSPNTSTGKDGFISMTALVTGLSAGSHTFKVQWKAQTAGTIGLFDGNNTSGQDFIPSFIAVEVA